jgi:hypothetical protein
MLLICKDGDAGEILGTGCWIMEHLVPSIESILPKAAK